MRSTTSSSKARGKGSSSLALGLFICYRRDDSAGYAGRLFDSLVREIPGVQVFMDIDSIGAGADYTKAIDEAIQSSDAVIVLIGRRWVDATDAGGRRLESPGDFVRLEIGRALARGARVIPVLVQGASMPGPEDLPSDIQELAKLQAFELTDTRWPDDVRRLVSVMESGRRPAPMGSRRAPWTNLLRLPLVWAAVLVPVVALVLFLVVRSGSGQGGPGAGSEATQNGPAPSPLSLESGAPACMGQYFGQISQKRFASVENGTQDQVVIPPGEPLGGPIGLQFTDFGRTIGGMRLLYVPSSQVFKIQSVVDASCNRVTDLEDYSGEPATDTMQNWDTIRVQLERRWHTVRIGSSEDIRVDFRDL